MDRREALGRFALLLTSVPLTLLLLECGLQVGALFVDGDDRRASVARVGGGLRILCLGDSNTYGLRLERQEAYPKQLEALWNADATAGEIEVLNLGFPGTNSSQLVRDSSRMLRTLMPDVVTVMVGANDFWTARVPVEPTTDWQSRVAEFFTRNSRAYRYLFIVRRSLQAPELEVTLDHVDEFAEGAWTARYGGEEYAVGWKEAKPGELKDPFAALERNLVALVERIRELRAEPILMTYPAHRAAYERANRLIRNAARTADVALIDHAAVFAEQCPDEACLELLFEDGHIKAPGNRLVALTLRDRLQREPQRGEPR